MSRIIASLYQRRKPTKKKKRCFIWLNLGRKKSNRHSSEKEGRVKSSKRGKCGRGREINYFGQGLKVNFCPQIPHWFYWLTLISYTLQSSSVVPRSKVSLKIFQEARGQSVLIRVFHSLLSNTYLYLLGANSGL